MGRLSVSSCKVDFERHFVTPLNILQYWCFGGSQVFWGEVILDLVEVCMPRACSDGRRSRPGMIRPLSPAACSL